MSDAEDYAAALTSARQVVRDFIWFTARDVETGLPVEEGVWSDLYDATWLVEHPVTRTAVSRAFIGGGSLIEVPAVPRVSGLTVQRVTMRLPSVDDRVIALVRGYDMKQAPVTIWRGYFDPETGAQTGAARVRFHGVVDRIEFDEPEEGATGSINLECTDATAQLNIASAAMRSDADQRAFASGDGFFADAGSIGDWTHFWGSKG